MGKKTQEVRDAVEQELHKHPSVTNFSWEILGSGHQRCKLFLSQGRKGMVVMSATPSDHRALKNIISDVRKTIHHAK